LTARRGGGYPYDWAGLPAAVRDCLAGDKAARRYKHIVIDEAQDLSPEAIRSLAEAIPADGRPMPNGGGTPASRKETSPTLT
jgi:hypothetical protein